MDLRKHEKRKAEVPPGKVRKGLVIKGNMAKEQGRSESTSWVSWKK